MVLVVREEPDGVAAPVLPHRHRELQPDHRPAVRGLRPAHRRPDGGRGLTDLFNHLTAYSRKNDYRRFLVAPQALRPGLVDRIEQQTALQQPGRPARIQLKCNAIIDEAIVDALYRASQAGVPIDVWVRGICSLRPGLPGLSETIRVRSILGRFLEHSRIYVFGAGAAGRH